MNKKLSNLEQLKGIRRYTLENGLKVIELYNEDMRVLLNESKCLDIMQVFYHGMNVSYISKNGFNTHDHLPFNERYEGGTLYTCGLESVGDRAGYPVHGSIHSHYMTIEKVYHNEESLIVEGYTRNSAIFGKNLLLKRKIVINKNTIELSDTLSNETYKDEKYSLLYHINLGYPMLDAGDTIEGDFMYVLARTEYAEENIDHYNVITEPVDNQEEMCYYIENKKDYVSVINPKLNLKFTINYSRDTLPNLIEWKSMASDDYALGLEPTTTLLDRDFKYMTIKSKDSDSFKIKISIDEIK